MKDKRLHVRCTAQQEAAIKHAAAIEGLSVTDFLMQAGIDRAHKAIREYHVIEVTLEQCDKMMEAIDRVEPYEEDEEEFLRRSYREHIDPTLRWLAENVTEWEKPKRNLINVINGKVVYPRSTYFSEYPFTYEQWLTARTRLGLTDNHH